MIDDQKPVMEEDPRLARILGLVLLVVIPVFGFYVASVFGKDWHYDYRYEDLAVSLRGAGYGFVVALFMNAYIWFRYTPQTNRDLVNEWYEPQAHKSGDHH